MTAKDYVLISSCIREEIEVSVAQHEVFIPKGLKGLAKALARDLGNDNPRFDGLRFLRACGLSDDEIGAQE